MRFYVTKTWHDWPEGGSYGTIVEASSHEEAENLTLREMATSLADTLDLEPIECCRRCDQTLKDGSGVCIDCGEAAYDPIQDMIDTYGHEWVTVDCFDLDQFIKEKSNG